ncbi:unnamed protein product, partial [Ranitomeya imitator]
MEKRKKTKELSEDLRNQIVRKHEQSQGYKSISKDLNVPVSTVRSVIKKFKAHGTVANLPRCGRKRKTDKRFQRKIVRMLDKEPRRLTSKQVQAALQSEGTTVSTRTIRRRLNEKGLYGNMFYVVMPTVSPLPEPEEEPQRPSELSRYREPEGSPNLTKLANNIENGNLPAQSIESKASSFDLPPSLVIQDVDTIFRTIEQLTVKLHRLQEVESAHHELLRSLKDKTTEDASQEPETVMVEDNKQPEVHHKSAVNSSSLSISVSLHRDICKLASSRALIPPAQASCLRFQYRNGS